MAEKPEIVVALCPTPNGILALTSSGRLFERYLDPRNFVPRNREKYLWKPAPGPLDAEGG